jgi:hypothetical protein
VSGQEKKTNDDLQLRSSLPYRKAVSGLKEGRVEKRVRLVHLQTWSGKLILESMITQRNKKAES